MALSYDISKIPFLTGNPQIEMQSGTVEVYRCLSKRSSQIAPEIDCFGSIDQNDEPCLFDDVHSHEDVLNGSSVLPSSKFLAFLCVPARFVPTDLISMLAPYHEHIKSVQLFRHCDDPRQFVAFLHIDSQAHAKEIHEAFDGKPFNSLEEVVALVAFAKCLTFDDARNLCRESGPPSPTKPEDKTEQILAITARLGILSETSRDAVTTTAKSTHTLVNQTRGEPVNGPISVTPAPPVKESEQCVVCLEHMDEGGVLTMACNHSFHLQCLHKWGDSPCPVCRYHHNITTVTSQCQFINPGSGEACARKNGLLVCVICGFVGCGGRLGHSKQHYENSLHAYSLEMDSQQVWDFAGDGYVHRLILTKGDAMKLSEAPDPNAIYSADDSEHYERRGLAHLSARAEEEATHRKLEGFAYQYNELLASQLDAQRVHFETELCELRESQGTVTAGLMSAVTYERRQLHQRMEGLKRRTKRVVEELKVVQACNEQIKENNKNWDRSRVLAEREAVEVKKASERLIPRLEEKVNSLMMQLDMDNKERQAAQRQAELDQSSREANDGTAGQTPECDKGEDDWAVDAPASGGGSAKKKKHGKKKK